MTWTFNGQSVVESDPDRCKLDYNLEEGVATLSIKDIKRSDAGNYHILVKNSVGLDELEMRLDVLAPPTAPKGFLEISGVNPTGCKLTWKKPEDDGGSPISGYTVEKKDVERDTWVACGKLSGKTMAVMKVTTDVFSTLCITIFYFLFVFFLDVGIRGDWFDPYLRLHVPCDGL